jgi:hypothetical protein
MSERDPAGLSAVDISKLSEDKLREVAKDLQQYYISAIGRDQQKQQTVPAIMNEDPNRYGTGASEERYNPHSSWTLSENEYPAQDSSVIYFDGRQTRVRTTRDLNSKCKWVATRT